MLRGRYQKDRGRHQILGCLGFHHPEGLRHTSTLMMNPSARTACITIAGLALYVCALSRRDSAVDFLRTIRELRPTKLRAEPVLAFRTLTSNPLNVAGTVGAARTLLR